jgi:hypothetical protein
MKWIGSEGSAIARDAVSAAEDADDTFAAVVAHLSTAGAGPVAAILAGDAALLKKSASALVLAFRLSADPALRALVETLSTQAMAETRAAALCALAEHDLVSADALVAILDDPSDIVAACAARLLAWLGRPASDRAVVESRLRPSEPAQRRCALQLAAVALGSAKALQQLRQALDSDQPVTAAAIDALAVAGGADDGARLFRLAMRQPDLAPQAVLAMGHLGDPATVEAMMRLDDVPAAVRNRAAQTTLGQATAVPARGGRLLYGAPWTMAASLSRLAAPDELLRSRPWYALEAAVRAGTRAGAVLDASTSIALQDRAVDGIRGAPAASRRGLATGGWIYFGK